LFEEFESGVVAETDAEAFTSVPFAGCCRTMLPTPCVVPGGNDVVVQRQWSPVLAHAKEEYPMLGITPGLKSTTTPCAIEGPAFVRVTVNETFAVLPTGVTVDGPVNVTDRSALSANAEGAIRQTSSANVKTRERGTIGLAG
jgi:hypothetical protein